MFCIGITVGRFVSGFITLKLDDVKMIRLGQAVVGLGIALILIPGLNEFMTVAGLILIGIGCGPIYPCALHSTPTHFGADRSQAIIGMPDIFIFDEPTNGLDVLTAKVVTDYLEQLRAEGKTVILSTHIFSLVEKLCDRVGIIIGGRMVVCDTLDAVRDGLSLEDRFFELYRETVGEEA